MSNPREEYILNLINAVNFNNQRYKYSQSPKIPNPSQPRNELTNQEIVDTKFNLVVYYTP